MPPPLKNPLITNGSAPKIFEWNCGPDAKKLIFKRQGEITDIEYYLCRIGKRLYFGQKTIYHDDAELTSDEVFREYGKGVNTYGILQATNFRPPPWKYYSLNGLKLDWTYKEVPIMEIIYMSLNYVFELYD
jgi:hypothetical protein